MIRLGTWNVNSIRARIVHLTDWLATAQPDIVCLQELKCIEAQFPTLEIEAAGYRSAIVGQATYNGVAILARDGDIDIRETALPGAPEDSQARYVEARVAGLRVASIYLPNGNGSADKLAYKHGWMERLAAHAATLLEDEVPTVLAGDYNVIPEAEDCYDPRAWEGDALFVPETRRHFRVLLNQGWTDAFRAVDSRPHQFTFWDYQAGRWQRDEGIRIDHILLSPDCADRLEGCAIDRTPRGWQKASDHTPVMVTLRA